MTENEIKETLEKQLQLLSERSRQGDDNLVAISLAICEVARLLSDLTPKSAFPFFNRMKTSSHDPLRMRRYHKLMSNEVGEGIPAIALPTDRKLYPGEMWPFRKLYSDEVFWAIPVDERDDA